MHYTDHFRELWDSCSTRLTVNYAPINEVVAIAQSGKLTGVKV